MIDYVVYGSIAQDQVRKHSTLARFTTTSHDNLVRRYKELDRKRARSTAKRIAYRTSLRLVPVGVRIGPVGTHTDLALVRREVGKQKRHIPIRQLVLRSRRALQALTPCWMMSPLSVAQYLAPGESGFDLVVMDEASQLKPEDAIGAVLRAAQLVVVGDPKQLPPTSFFDRLGSDLDEPDEQAGVQEVESILEQCMSIFSRRRLIWLLS